MTLLLAALGGLVLWLALRAVLPARVWADLTGALDYLVRFAWRSALVILALVIVAAVVKSMHG